MLGYEKHNRDVWGLSKSIKYKTIFLIGNLKTHRLDINEFQNKIVLFKMTTIVIRGGQMATCDLISVLNNTC